MLSVEQATKADPHALAIARAAQDAVAPGATVVLFGSRATGRHRPDSDVDLMVLTHHKSPQVMARAAARAARKYMERHPPWLAVNSVGFAWRDYARYSKAGLHVTGQAARYGVFMSSEGTVQPPNDDAPRETGHPAHWPATSLRVRNVLRHKHDLERQAEHLDMSTELFGFTAQQAVENALKGWLSAYNVQRDYGHDLLHLWETIQEVEDRDLPTADAALRETARLFAIISYDEAGDPADWLTSYAVIYRYHGVVYEADSAYIQSLANRIGQTVDAIMAHIYLISGVSPEDPGPTFGERE